MSALSAVASRPAVAESSRPVYWYAVYGLRILSDFKFPGVPTCARGWVPDVCFRRVDETGVPAPDPRSVLVAELRCYGACHAGSVFSRVHRSDRGTWIRNPGLGVCHVTPDGRQVTVAPAPDADQHALGWMLAGLVLTFCLHQLGYPTLHASGVMTERGAVAFLGPHGQGKSTLAANLLRRGATLLTDDALPLWHLEDGVYAAPGLPLMKLWPATAANALGLSECLPSLTSLADKRVLVLTGRYPVVRTPARVHALYVLGRYDSLRAGTADIELRAIGPSKSVMALVSQTAGIELLYPTEVARLLPLYAALVAQAPVRVLRFPSGFEHQERLYARIMMDLSTK